MRIERLRVHGFGRLAEREFEFGPGLTVVHGPNEAGKSTLHAALTASLVGLAPGGRRTPTSTALVERHRPWTHDRYGTRLDLAFRAGRRLRLDWDFGRPAFTVTDAATGAEVTSRFGAGTDPDALCRELYGVSRDSFLGVASVRQGELDAIGDSAGVRQAIERVAGQAGEADGAAGALAALRAERSRTVGLNRSRTNPLPQAEREVQELAGALETAQAERAAAEADAAERDRLAELAGQLETRRVGLETAYAASRARQLRARVERAQALDGECRGATAVLDAESGGWRPVDGLEGARERARDLEQRSAGAGPELAETRHRLAELESRPRIAPPHPPRALGRALGLAGVGLALAAAGLAGGRFAVLAAGIVLAAAAAGLGVLDGSRAAARHRQALANHERAVSIRAAETSRLRTELARLELLAGELEAARAQLGSLLGVDPEPGPIAAALAAYDQEAAGHRERERAAHRREVAAAELRSLLDGVTLDDLAGSLARIEGELNGHRNAPGAERDPEDLARELERLRSHREQALMGGEAASARVAERLRNLPDTAELAERLAAARERLAAIQRRDAVLRLAEQELSEAAAETYRDFAPRLNVALQARLAQVTRGRYTTAYVGDDLSVRLESPETGAPIDLDRTSMGTQKLAYLVQRLELVGLLAPTEEPLPVLLDDPFAHLDHDRIGNALELLAELAGERQLIVFTTQADVVERAPAGTTLVELA